MQDKAEADWQGKATWRQIAVPSPSLPLVCISTEDISLQDTSRAIPNETKFTQTENISV